MMTVRQLVEEPLLIGRLTKEQRLERVLSVLREVGLIESQLDARPGSMSGGRMQRVAMETAAAPVASRPVRAWRTR
jgi:peptide/nickel transport system ATP-binding protein